MNQKRKGILLMLLSSLSFAAMGAFVKLSGDIPSFEKALFRNLVSLMIVLVVLARRKISPWGKKENRYYLIGRGVSGTIGLLAFFYGIDRLLLADSSMLNKLSPFFVIVFAAIFLKEKIKSYQVVSLGIALLGVIAIIKPSFNFGESWAAIICLLSAVFAGLAYVFVSYLSQKEDTYVIVFYFSFISTIVTGLLVLQTFVMPDFLQFIYLLSAGISAAIGQFTLTYAYRYAPAGEISIYNYSNVVFSSLLGILLFFEIPDIYSIIGYLLIISAGYIIYKYGRSNKE